MATGYQPFRRSQRRQFLPLSDEVQGKYGSLAVQLAKAREAVVIGTASSAAKLDLLQRQGVYPIPGGLPAAPGSRSRARSPPTARG
jgi:D-arabinose 1-dehydrogenase-like Zn-dependent alcohol dehydrogenase